MLRTVIGSVFLLAVVVYILHFSDLPLLIDKLRNDWPNQRDEANSIQKILSYNATACHLYFQFGSLQEDLNRTENFCETVDGQKAVCLDPGLAPPAGVCVIYSFGLYSESLSFERAMTSYGCDVYAFDRSAHQFKKPSNYQHLHLFSMTLGSQTARNLKGKTLKEN